ncbi:MAG: hypothetical protein K8S13_03720, partial [Desulfobacula sp.]|uniref:hypothetical protein n=1 Tax=Desulfobacula sp. TaxID=2593537 RepID=UPI0025BEA7B6
FETSEEINKMLANASEENLKKLKNDFNEICCVFEKRIEILLDSIRDLERRYYQEYQLRLIEKTQELTLLSIIIATIIFLIKMLWDQIKYFCFLLVDIFYIILSQLAFWYHALQNLIR